MLNSLKQTGKNIGREIRARRDKHADVIGEGIPVS
jgi:hypothetical protein